MTLNLWTVIVGLGIALLGHIITVTVFLTKLHMRLTSVEKTTDGLSGLDSRLVRMETHMDNVLDEVRKINVGLDWLRPLASPAPPPPPRRRRENEE